MTDLLTRKEAAELLRVPPSRLSKGWGPPSLPGYKRPVYYSRELIERWLAEQRCAAWESTSAARHGGTASKPVVVSIEDQQANEIAERLRRQHAQSKPPSKPPTLIAVPRDL
jgi:hypothetical protein